MDQTATTAQPTGNPAGTPASTPEQGIPWLLVVGAIACWVMLFYTMKNSKAKATDRESELAGMKKGDTVVMISRLRGTVVALDEKTVTIQPDPKNTTRLTFDREAVFRVNPDAKKDAEKTEA